MNIVLSWDLVIILFFATIIAYGFIIGRDGTIRTIISTYIAMLAADGLGNLANQYLGGTHPILNLLGGPDADMILITAKIVLFIIVIVLLTVRGGFAIDIYHEHRTLIRLLMTLLFSTLSAGLIVSALLLYVSGLSIIGAEQIGVAHSFASDSLLVTLMVTNYNFWFSLPAIAIVGLSFVEGEET